MVYYQEKNGRLHRRRRYRNTTTHFLQDICDWLAAQPTSRSVLRSAWWMIVLGALLIVLGTLGNRFGWNTPLMDGNFWTFLILFGGCFVFGYLMLMFCAVVEKLLSFLSDDHS